MLESDSDAEKEDSLDMGTQEWEKSGLMGTESRRSSADFNMGKDCEGAQSIILLWLRLALRLPCKLPALF